MSCGVIVPIDGDLIAAVALETLARGHGGYCPGSAFCDDDLPRRH